MWNEISEKPMNEFILNRNAKPQTFKTDQSGIDNLKNQFFNEAREFVYFRKGDWAGFHRSLQNARNYMQKHPNVTLTALTLSAVPLRVYEEIASATNIPIKKVKQYLNESYVDKARNKQDFVTIRVICGERALGESEIKELEKITNAKGSVKTITKSQAGDLRYIVNEQSYAIFFRVDKDDLRGVVGFDKEMISMLQLKFDKEFYVAAIRNAELFAPDYLGH